VPKKGNIQEIHVTFIAVNAYPQLNLPPCSFRMKEEGAAVYIFDEIRKKFLLLTPEEWVRQHFIKYLVTYKKYPRSLIRLEGGVKVNSLQKRSDILLYNSLGEKIMLIECKAPNVKLVQGTFDQVARYNLVHKAPLLVITNGLSHHYCRIDFITGSYEFLNDLPEYVNAGLI
jgi:hypothetical protein